MYATSSSSDVYHLLTEAETADSTLCGPVKASWLHLTTNRPTDRELCRECAQIALDRATRV
jgi:hypothetical protein